MTTVQIKFKKLHSNARVPYKASSQAAAYDAYACIDKPVDLQPGQRMAISTGLALEIPEGYLVSVRPRSGLAIKHGITMINSPGTIDADYRGEVKILLVNLGTEVFRIEHHDRIGQLLVEKAFNIEWAEASVLTETERAEGGFGSTGSS